MEKYEILKFLKVLGIDVSLWVAGLFGALVNINRMGKLSKVEGFLYLVSGSATAVYITPLFIAFTGLEFSLQTATGMGFVVGYMGLTSIIYTIDTIKKRLNVKTDDKPE